MLGGDESQPSILLPKCMRYVLCYSGTYSVHTNAWMCRACLKRDADSAGPNIVKAILTKSLKISTIRECRNLRMSFKDTEF
jgi:hypothetical protein